MTRAPLSKKFDYCIFTYIVRTMAALEAEVQVLE